MMLHRTKKTIKTSCICCLLIVLSIGSILADFDARRWSYYKNINGEAASGTQYGQVVIDREILCSSRFNLADLRVVDNQKREIPYKLLADAGDAKEKQYTPRIFNKSDVPGKYNSFVLDLGRTGLISNRLQISTPNTNFMQRVQIEGSQNGTDWAVIKTDGYIFDYSREHHAANTSVSYPDNNSRYIRAKLWHYGQPAITIDEASVFWIQTESVKEMLVFDGSGSITQNNDERSTDITIDTGCRKLPGGWITISSSSVNYNRQVEVASSNDNKGWTSLSSDYIMKYNTPQFKGEKSRLQIEDSGSRYIRVRIKNYDDEPINISNIKVFIPRNRILFPYNSGQQYRLYYGSKAASAPIYDFEQTAQYITASSTAELTLGVQEKNPQFSPAASPGSWMEENPWIIWVVLAAAVVFLGALTVRMFMQMKDQRSQQ